MRKRLTALWWCAGILALGLCSATPATAITPVGPVVRVMPDGVKTTTRHTAYTWAGNTLSVWGNVTWGASTSGSFEWNFGDATANATGAIIEPRDIAVTHTYTAAGTYYAVLTVTDGNSQSSQAQVRIDVLPTNDGQAAINLAIERGLKNLYMAQSTTNGSWVNEPALTALPVLAFENRGHLPISAASDIYRNTVVNGLNYLFTTLYYTYDSSGTGTFNGLINSKPANWTGVDANGDGAIIGQYYPNCGNCDESFYPHGMIMMALAASGPYDANYPVTDAVHNPALNLTVPTSVANIGGWTYYKVLQDMVEFAAWAQADPSYGGRGGWRYDPNGVDADNSVGQWPVIGLEAAEQWGIVAPSWVKDELKTYWLVNSYVSSVAGWGYDGANYTTMSHSGAGLSMLSYVGVAKSDAWYQAALSRVADEWSGPGTHPYLLQTFTGGSWDWWPSHFGPTVSGDVRNYYAMYGLAKALRIARDSSGKVSPITVLTRSDLTTFDWYATYANFLLPIQSANGSFGGWWQWGEPLSTAFAVLILEPTVSSLRPQASIVASPNPVTPTTTVYFNISGSTHQDPAKYLVSWKLDFNAANGVNWATPDASGSFPAGVPIPKSGGYPETGGDYSVIATLQVTDNVGDTSEASVTVNVTSGWVPPIAAPGGPYFGSIGAPVTLNGGASYSPNVGGTIAKYEWDLDGNGTYETDAGASASYGKTWASPYTGQIGLRVTDNMGVSSTANVYTRITVSDLKPVSYPLFSYRRISASVWEYAYKFTIKNQGTGDASAVSAQLQNWPAQVTVLDGTVAFGTVAAGATVTSAGADPTFKIRIDRAVAVQNSDLTWKLTFTDPGGTNYTLVNFPLY